MLSQFVSVYVPGTKNVNQQLTARERSQYTARVASDLSKEFGGATATRGTGFYVSNDGRLISENTTIVKSYHDHSPAQALEFARSIAQWLKVELTQESVTVENNDGIEFI